MHKRITSIVISFHLLFITFLLFNPPRTSVKSTSPMKVRTFHPIAHSPLSPPQKKVQKSVIQQIPPPPPKKTSAPQPAIKKQVTSPKSIPKPGVLQKEKPSKKKIETPPSDGAQKKIWNEIDQALAKIEEKSYPISKPLPALPKPLKFLDEHDSEENTQEEKRALLDVMGFLHDTLHLPEVGEVRIAITVRKDGVIAKVVVLHAESQKNKLYLQEHLPLLQLPLQLDQEKIWTITFCNEI